MLRQPLAIARGAALLALTLGLLGLLAAPALAHGRGSDATNYASVIRSAPDLPGVTWRVLGNDEYLEIANTSAAEVVVLGYEGEDYLRVGPDGVFENRNSPAAYLNADRFGQSSVPPDADAEAEPDWVQVSGATSHLWHDHRAHWMAFEPPQPVQQDPSVERVVLEWEVPFRYDGAEQMVTGDLSWIPPTSALPWLLGAAVLTLPALAGLFTKPASEERWPGLARPAALLLGLLAAANLIHLGDDLFAVALPLTTRAFAAVQTTLFILIAGFGALRGWQAREGAFTAIGVGAAALLVGQGLLYAAVLSTSQTASLWPAAVTRIVVALSLVQALPLGIVAVIGTRRLLPPLEDADPGASEVAPAAT